MDSPTLVSVQDIRERGGLADVVDLNERVNEANKLTTRRLATQVRTDFDVVTLKDVFVFDRHLVLPGGITKMKLTRGFVDGASTFEVRTANTVKDVLDDLLATLLEAEDFVVELEKGRVVFPATEPVKSGIVRIDYTAGFTTNTQEPYNTFFDADLVPTWLHEAAVQWGLQTYDWLKDPKRSERKLHKELEFGLISDHIRYFGETADPTMVL